MLLVVKPFMFGAAVVYYACFSIIVKKMLPISVDQGADYAVTDSMEAIELIDNILGELNKIAL